MQTLSFKWNATKAKANLVKHKVSFQEAKTVFGDSNARLIYDPDHSEGEDRFILLGLSSDVRILTVVHCCRDSEDCIRIISARKATKKETEQYKEYLL